MGVNLVSYLHCTIFKVKFKAENNGDGQETVPYDNG